MLTLRNSSEFWRQKINKMIPSVNRSSLEFPPPEAIKTSPPTQAQFIAIIAGTYASTCHRFINNHPRVAELMQQFVHFLSANKKPIQFILAAALISIGAAISVGSLAPLWSLGTALIGIGGVMMAAIFYSVVAHCIYKKPDSVGSLLSTICEESAREMTDIDDESARGDLEISYRQDCSALLQFADESDEDSLPHIADPATTNDPEID